jgi:hypothetical protein
MMLYQWFEYVSVANPEFTPLFSTIVTHVFHVTQAITDMILQDDCYIVWYRGATLNRLYIGDAGVLIIWHVISRQIQHFNTLKSSRQRPGKQACN